MTEKEVEIKGSRRIRKRKTEGRGETEERIIKEVYILVPQAEKMITEKEKKKVASKRS